MPYVEGESLRDKLNRERQLPIDEAIRITTEVAHALDYAHRHDVIHRDIKPENVLLQDGRPLVADFGIALAVSAAGGTRITETGLAVGTPVYMSPEQASGDRELDRRSDIYSLGCIVYEMLAGEPPFTGPSAQAIMARHSMDPVPSLRTVRGTVPETAEQAITRALAKAPADRFATTVQFVEALATPSGGVVLAQPAAVQSRTRHIAVITAALVLASVGAAVLLSTGASDEIKVGRTRQLTFASGLELDPAISPDGKMIAYSAGLATEMHIYVRQISGGRSIALAEGLAGHHRWPQWSPDGAQIAFQAGVTFYGGTIDLSGGSVYAVPTLGGAPKKMVDPSPGAAVLSLVWSPEGQQVAYVEGEAIYVRPVGGGEPREITPAYRPHSLSWSPDGSWIAYVSGSPLFVLGTVGLGDVDPSTLWVVPATGGDPVQITDDEYQNVSPQWTPDGRRLFFVSSRGGSRDIYQIALSGSGISSGMPMRLTTGLNAHTISLSADGRQLASSVFTVKANIWSIQLSESAPVSIGEAERVTDEIQKIEAVSITRDGKWLAFDSDREANHDIYRMLTGGGEPERLTADPSDDYAPSWSPDGREIAFYSFRSGNRDIYVMSADGRSPRRLTIHSAQERYPDWSADGSRLVFQSDRTGREELYVIARGSGSEWSAPEQLTLTGGYHSRWSPDGGLIAYFLADGLAVISPDGGDPRILVETRDRAGRPVPRFPAWSPDSRTVYYWDYDEKERPGLWSVPISGGLPSLRLRFDDPLKQVPLDVFATDGQRVFFVINEYEADIWMIELLQN